MLTGPATVAAPGPRCRARSLAACQRSLSAAPPRGREVACTVSTPVGGKAALPRRRLACEETAAEAGATNALRRYAIFIVISVVLIRSYHEHTARSRQSGTMPTSRAVRSEVDLLLEIDAELLGRGAFDRMRGARGSHAPPPAGQRPRLARQPVDDVLRQLQRPGNRPGRDRERWHSGLRIGRHVRQGGLREGESVTGARSRPS